MYGKRITPFNPISPLPVSGFSFPMKEQVLRVWRFSHIENYPRLKFGLDYNFAAIYDLVYHLQTNQNNKHPGWCTARRKTMYSMIGLSESTSKRALSLGVKIGLIEYHSNKMWIKTTKLYWQEFVENPRIIAQKELSEDQFKNARSVNLTHRTRSNGPTYINKGISTSNTTTSTSVPEVVEESKSPPSPKKSLHEFLKLNNTAYPLSSKNVIQVVGVYGQSKNRKKPYEFSTIFQEYFRIIHIQKGSSTEKDAKTGKLTQKLIAKIKGTLNDEKKEVGPGSVLVRLEELVDSVPDWPFGEKPEDWVPHISDLVTHYSKFNDKRRLKKSKSRSEMQANGLRQNKVKTKSRYE